MTAKGTLTKKFHEVVRDLKARDHWRAADGYFEDLFVSGDPVLAAALAASDAAGLPTVSVSPSQGKLLNLLAVGLRARRILEIGTLGGYSAIWLARALPEDGRLITLEVDPRAADVARANLAAAGLAAVADVRLGPASETLQQLASAGEQPFDLIFIDADKTGYRDYLDGSLRLARPGTMIIADNVVQGGYVAEAGTQGPRRARDTGVPGASGPAGTRELDGDPDRRREAPRRLFGEHRRHGPGNRARPHQPARKPERQGYPGIRHPATGLAERAQAEDDERRDRRHEQRRDHVAGDRQVPRHAIPGRAQLVPDAGDGGCVDQLGSLPRIRP